MNWWLQKKRKKQKKLLTKKYLDIFEKAVLKERLFLCANFTKCIISKVCFVGEIKFEEK